MKNWTFRWIRLFSIFWVGYFIAIALALVFMGAPISSGFLEEWMSYVAGFSIPALVIFLLLLAGEYYSYKKGDAKKK